MEDPRNPLERQLSITQDDDASARPPRTSRGESAFRRRRRRLHDLRNQALQNPDSLAAGVGFVTADLLELEMIFGRAILKDLGAETTVQDLEERSSSIGQLIGLSKRSAEFTKLEMNMTKLEGAPNRPILGPGNALKIQLFESDSPGGEIR